MCYTIVVFKMAAYRGVHAFSKKACRIFDFKPNGNLLKVQSPLAQILTGSARPIGSVSAVSVSPKARQLLRNINRNNSWSKSVLENISRSASSPISLLGSCNVSLLTCLCSALDELSTDGDEDSTNRKKRIYLTEHTNDDP